MRGGCTAETAAESDIEEEGTLTLLVVGAAESISPPPLAAAATAAAADASLALLLLSVGKALMRPRLTCVPPALGVVAPETTGKRN